MAASSTVPARWPTPTTATWAPDRAASPLYKGGRTVVERNIPQEEALDRLVELIKKERGLDARLKSRRRGRRF